MAAALADPLLGRRARSAALRLPIPEQALEELALSEVRATRHDTYRLLRISRRQALAARLLPDVHTRHGARDAAALLPACSADTVAAWLSRLEPEPGTLNSLARTAPRAVAAYLAAQRAQYAQQTAYTFAHRHRSVASVAASRDPGAALLLLERAPDLLTPRGVLSALHRPAEALAVLRASDPDTDGRPPRHPLPTGPLPPAVQKALLELPVEDLAALAAYCPAKGSRRGRLERLETTPDSMLLRLPPADRRRVVEGVGDDRKRPGDLPLSALAALEPSDRAALTAPLFQQRARRLPRTTARRAAVLPLAEGEPRLRELTDNHRSFERALAWPALLACAELEGDPEEFARIAVDCERAWHDRDEVRRATLEQLAEAAPHLLSALPERVLRDATLTAVQSRDSTSGTHRAVRRLLYRVAERAAVTGRPDRAALAVGREAGA
ncbi:hypothetical protein [Streptomyces sp. P17]|uniref:hypothetical protein n=1 Tax=Streptomyces sp. P17 TaxID=3074716 RepID=UPI0028F3EF39|nr:hypothetical protein [Streptomyces sp. P17]MDT9696806.1 hypothetical protein [Streptomyces sp. P17]